MKLLRLCIALLGLLAFVGSSQACVILGQHLSEVGCADKCASDDDQACVGCATAVGLVAQDDWVRPPVVQAIPPVWPTASMELWATNLAEEAQTHPPPDPPFVRPLSWATTRCLPVRGPNVLG